MKRISIISILLFALCLIACRKDDITENLPADIRKVHEESGKLSPKSSRIVQNKILVKIKPEYLEQINIARTRSNISTCGIQSLDDILSRAKANDITPLFPVDKRFVKRHHKAGLDTWYIITLPDSTTSATRSAEQENIIALPAIEYAGPVRYPELLGDKSPKPYISTAMQPKAISEAYFNDKLLPLQWHYNNTGELFNSQIGADINLYEAWGQTTGSPNVIVSIIDGGIDINHEDLHDNIWVNKAEKDGQPGKDDDNNGFVDDVYGWNFIDENNTIIPHMHGTHVAGTIGAVNNNHIGVCGIAGGDGTPGSGVKLMNSQIFKPGADGRDQSAEDAQFAQAIVYGADNGAVISQNSWGITDPEEKLTDVPPAVKAAIDYFIENAGCDDDGNQLPGSPMKGGVVIFAAGNDGKDHKVFPAAYDKVISVASIAPNFRMASYSTHGDWITLSAPGGDETMIPNYIKSEYGVLSTLPDNKYGWLDGTSMACPHVSGIAALILSKYGGQGFTNEKLKEYLLKGTNDIYIDNPDKQGKMGTGYIDADKALSVNKHQAPNAVKDLSLVSDTTRITLSWKTASDPDDKFASWYYVIASEKPFGNTIPDFKRPESGLMIQKIRAIRNKDTVMYGKSAMLPVGKHYYLSVVSEDRWGNISEPSNMVEATVKNGIPVIHMKELVKKIRITGTEEGELIFHYQDPDNDEMNISLEGDVSTVSIKPDGKKGESILKITTGNLKAGKYKGYFVVTDTHQGVKKHPFEFEVYDNSAPVVTRPIDYINLSFGDKKRVLLGKYFTDPDNHRISYKLSDKGDESIADVQMGSGYLSIIGLKKGVTTIKLHVEDTQKGVLEKSIRVVVSNDSMLYNVAPTETSDFVNIFLNENVKGLVRITLYNAYGQKITRRIINADNNKDTKIDLRSLPLGVYIINIENKDMSKKINIVKK